MAQVLSPKTKQTVVPERVTFLKKPKRIGPTVETMRTPEVKKTTEDAPAFHQGQNRKPTKKEPDQNGFTGGTFQIRSYGRKKKQTLTKG